MEKSIYNYTRIQQHSNAYCLIFDQMNKAIAYIILLLDVNALHAQNANPDRKRTRHWVFGEKNWIEWTDTSALQHPGSKAIQTEQMAVFTDIAGNLQLYFDSKNIYDSEHNVIANGAITDGFWSFHRGAIFVPYPKNDSLCYLFYTMYASGRSFCNPPQKSDSFKSDKKLNFKLSNHETIKIHRKPDCKRYCSL